MVSPVAALTVVQQFYQSEVNNEYVIRGNSAILKCSIPSFVADFVSVLSWNDENGNIYTSSVNDAGATTSNNQFGLFSIFFYFCSSIEPFFYS